MVYQKKKQFSKKITIWRLTMILVLMTIVSATLLRLNNVRMIQRRDSVLLADEAGDDDVLVERLFELKKYAFSHMNSSTGPFFLEDSYRRQTEEIIAEAKKKADNNDQKYYKQAQDTCEARFRGKAWSSHYVNCYLKELEKSQKISQSSLDNKVLMPDVNLYRRNYSSPLLSFDWAGLSVMAWIIIALMIIIKILYKVFLSIFLYFKKDKTS